VDSEFATKASVGSVLQIRELHGDKNLLPSPTIPTNVWPCPLLTPQALVASANFSVPT